MPVGIPWPAWKKNKIQNSWSKFNVDQSEACIASIDQSQTWSDWSVARGTDIWLPGWPGLTPGWGMITLCTPAPPTDTGGAANTTC